MVMFEQDDVHLGYTTLAETISNSFDFAQICSSKWKKSLQLEDEMALS